MEEMIQTNRLTKHYGKVHAVEGVSLAVRKGEIYGFLGLNGAGKTTTIRMLLGMIRPTSGAAYLKGKKVDSGRHELWNQVGYLVEVPYAYPELTVRENLEMVRQLRLIADPGSVDAVIEQLQLSPYRDRLAKNLSLGNAQRLGLAKALLHHPEILILDEPANGLDPAGIVEIRELLHHLARVQGVTVLISSHILGEISKFATRIGIIHEGRLVQEADTDQLDRYRYRSLQVNTPDKEGAKSMLAKQGYKAVIGENGFLEVTDVEAIGAPEKVADLLVRGGYPLKMLKVEEEDLESYFMRTVAKNGGVTK
ncbi:MAG: ABC transporter ATP-binding protein [Firmicutes bacterium]|nr:ABC transporter ATP-binding protein [Bacillota bacterium]